MPDPGYPIVHGVREAAYGDEVNDARVAWAAAGGALPGIGGIEGTPAGLGTSPVRDSSFNQIGKECFATARIVLGASPTPPTGYWSLTGLPVAPKMTTGHGRHIGYGFMLDASDSYRLLLTTVTIDPAFSLTIPVFFVYAANTDTIGEDLVSVPSYLNTGKGIASGAFPWDLAEADIINVTLQYEGV